MLRGGGVGNLSYVSPLRSSMFIFDVRKASNKSIGKASDHTARTKLVLRWIARWPDDCPVKTLPITMIAMMNMTQCSLD